MSQKNGFDSMLAFSAEVNTLGFSAAVNTLGFSAAVNTLGFSAAVNTLGFSAAVNALSQGLLQLQAWVCLGFYKRAADFYE